MKIYGKLNEEIIKLGKEFYLQAYPKIDDFYNLAFWILLNKRSARKIVINTYRKAIYYCDKTMGGAEWQTWMERIFINFLKNDKEYAPGADEINPGLIEHWKIQTDSINNILDNIINLADEKAVFNLSKQIPKALQIPLVLNSVYKISPERISTLLDIPKPVVASRIYRARKLFFIVASEFKYGKSSGFKNKAENQVILSAEELNELISIFDEELNETKKSIIMDKLKNNALFKAELEVLEQVESLAMSKIKKKYAPESLKRKVKNLAEKRFSGYFGSHSISG